MILDNAFVSVNGVDLSDHVREVNVDDSSTEVDNRTMGHRATSTKVGSITWSITVRFLQNFAASKVHATLLPLLRRNDVAVIVRVDKDDAVSATNPEISGTAYFGRYSPVAGAVGTQQEPVAEFKAAGDPLTYTTVPTP